MFYKNGTSQIVFYSGSGKTTLLATLSRRIKGFDIFIIYLTIFYKKILQFSLLLSFVLLLLLLLLLGEIEGEILLNGKSISKEEMIKISSFVPQQDLAIESLTVQEHMEFMVCL